AADPAAYQITGFTYQYHSTYGSDVMNQADAPVRSVAVAPDARSVRLVVDGLRAGYVHELKASGVRSAAGAPLLHDVAYYTLNRSPGGDGAQAHSAGALHAPGAAEHAPAPTPATGADQTRVPESSTNATAPAETAPKRQTTMPASWR